MKAIMKTMLRAIAPPPSTLNLSASKNFSRLKTLIEAREQTDDLKMLNIGSGDGFTRGMNFLGPNILGKITNLDIFPGDNVDIVASAESIPLDDNSIDCVIAEAVLPEIPDARKAIKEIERILKVDGLIYIDAPFLQPIYSGSLNRYTLESLMKNFDFIEIIDSGISCGPSSTVTWILIEYLSLLFSFQNKYLESLNRLFWGWLLSPIKYLDKFLINYNDAYKIASGVYLIGKKKPKIN